jgi:general secretion pathway protein K
MRLASGQNRRHERGIALLLVIWTLALLSAIAVAVTADSRSVRRITHNIERAAQAKAVAEGGIRWGMAQLLDGRPDRQLSIDGQPQVIEIGEFKVRVSIEAETGKFDLNTSPPAVLENLLMQSGASALEARRVAAAVSTHREASRNDPGRPRKPAFLETLDLRRVSGLEEGLYRQILPFITVYSGRTRLDPAVAPREVLLAIPGATTQQVESILRHRRQPAGYKAASEATGYVGPSNPTIFRIRSAVPVNSDTFVTGSAIVEVTGKPFAPLYIHDWMMEAR